MLQGLDRRCEVNLALEKLLTRYLVELLGWVAVGRNRAIDEVLPDGHTRSLRIRPNMKPNFVATIRRRVRQLLVLVEVGKVAVWR